MSVIAEYAYRKLTEAGFHYGTHIQKTLISNRLSDERADAHCQCRCKATPEGDLQYCVTAFAPPAIAPSALQEATGKEATSTDTLAARNGAGDNITLSVGKGAPLRSLLRKLALPEQVGQSSSPRYRARHGREKRAHPFPSNARRPGERDVYPALCT